MKVFCGDNQSLRMRLQLKLHHINCQKLHNSEVKTIRKICQMYNWSILDVIYRTRFIFSRQNIEFHFIFLISRDIYCNIWLFPKLKTSLKGSLFENRNELIQIASENSTTFRKKTCRILLGTCRHSEQKVCGYAKGIIVGGLRSQSHQVTYIFRPKIAKQATNTKYPRNIEIIFNILFFTDM